jgi:hypothetical protein
MQISELRAARFTLLKRLYEVTGGSTHTLWALKDIGAELGFDEKLTIGIGEYLVNEGLMEYRTSGPRVSITHAGVREVEEALAHPERPTEHFPPVNFISIGQMIGSTIQQGTVQSSQAVTISATDIDQFSAELVRLGEALQSVQLTAEQRGDVNAELETLNAQLKSSKPKRLVLRESLDTIRSVIEGAAGSLLASEVLVRLLAVVGL